MRQFTNGEGWCFEFIEGELCFFHEKGQWNYKLEDLIIENQNDYRHAILIKHKLYDVILKISIHNSMLIYWEISKNDFPYWKVDIVEYNKLVTFFNKII